MKNKLNEFLDAFNKAKINIRNAGNFKGITIDNASSNDSNKQYENQNKDNEYIQKALWYNGIHLHSEQEINIFTLFTIMEQPQLKKEENKNILKNIALILEKHMKYYKSMDFNFIDKLDFKNVEDSNNIKLKFKEYLIKYEQFYKNYYQALYLAIIKSAGTISAPQVTFDDNTRTIDINDGKDPLQLEQSKYDEFKALKLKLEYNASNESDKDNSTKNLTDALNLISTNIKDNINIDDLNDKQCNLTIDSVKKKLFLLPKHYTFLKKILECLTKQKQLIHNHVSNNNAIVDANKAIRKNLFVNEINKLQSKLPIQLTKQLTKLANNLDEYRKLCQGKYLENFNTALKKIMEAKGNKNIEIEFENNKFKYRDGGGFISNIFGGNPFTELEVNSEQLDLLKKFHDNP